MTGKTALGLLLITRGGTMLNNNVERKEPIYWTAYQLARAITKEGLSWGFRPAEMLDALTAGFEKALKDHREMQDQSNAGH